MQPAGRLAGIATLVLLCGASLVLAFRHGAYSPIYWLPLLVGVAALALTLALAAPGAWAGRSQKVLLALFAAQTVWTALSLLWASSPFNAWQELNRTLLFGLGLVLAFVAVRWIGGRGLEWLAALITAVAAVVGLAIVVRLATAVDPAALFVGGRLNYPITYWNALASFLMLGFWLALGLANAGWERRSASWDAAPEAGDGPLRRDRARARGAVAWRFVWAPPVLLAVAVVLLELALLPQSRGALWTFFLVVPFFVLLSPHRFRALLQLAFVVLPVILFWDRLNGVYVAFPEGASPKGALDVALGSALGAVGFSVLVVWVLWLVSWALERWIGLLSRRVTLAVATVLVVLTLAGAAAGLVVADRHTGGLGGYLGDRWTEFTSDAGTGGNSGSRFSEVSLNGRIIQWKIAARAFAEEPLLGLGAQNYEAYYFQHRTSLLEVRQPHSQPMQLLAELGLPGFLLWITLVAAALLRALVLRLRTSDRATAAALAAVMTAVLSWFIHSSADWIWQLTAVSLPAMMLVGGLIASGRAPETSKRRSPATWRSAALRAAGAVICVGVLVSAALPYLSLHYTEAAARTVTGDIAVGLEQARSAERFDPTSPQPFATRASLHEAAARAAAAGSTAQMEHYALAASEWQGGIAKEPSNWVLYLQAANLNVEWSRAVAGQDPAFARDLALKAEDYLEEVAARNPLSPELTQLRETISLTIDADAE